MRYLIIGSSAAGLSALETIRKNDTESKITVVTSDSSRPHSRILTSYLLGEKISEEDIFLRSPNYFSEMGAELIADTKVVGVDPVKKEVELSSEKVITYDKLLIATGASPKIPDYKGKNLNGVFSLRNYDDVKQIRDYLKKDIEHCFVFGGGLIGMKATEAFYDLNKKVSIIIRSPQILSQMLDRKSAGIIENHLKNKGINILKGEFPKKIKGFNRVKGVKLSSGKKIKGGLVLIGKGVSPNTNFIDEGINLNKYGGIVVDERMKTNDPDVFAAGDLVSAPDLLDKGKSSFAIWPDAVWQGRVAGTNMAGKKSSYEGGLNLNVLNVLGLIFFAVGKVRFSEKEKDKYNIYIKNRPEDRVYRKLVFSDQRLIGAITIGQSDDIGVLYNLIKKRFPIEDKAETILKQGIDYAELIRDKVLLKEVSRLCRKRC